MLNKLFYLIKNSSKIEFNPKGYKIYYLECKIYEDIQIYYITFINTNFTGRLFGKKPVSFFQLFLKLYSGTSFFKFKIILSTSFL